MSEPNPKDEEPALKRLKTSSLPEKDPQQTKTSLSIIVTWNANGLVSRCLYNEDELRQLLHATDPDVLCIQEARLKAMGPANRGTPTLSDYKSVKKVLESSVFGNYRRFWSLADKRYAGTLTLIHKRLQIPTRDFEAFTTRSAVSILLKKYNLKRGDIGLSSSTSAPTSSESGSQDSFAAETGKKQTSISAFFTPKSSSSNNKPFKLLPPEHHPDGRFQFFCFPNCDIIQTYVPNNGKDEKSFQRRREWDGEMKDFLEQRRLILVKADQKERPLLWCGDMNVARDYRDGTHWEERCTGKSTDGDSTTTIYEWWRDETQCFAKGQAKDLDPNRSPDDCGIASFTTNERRRFAEILQQGDLSDVWRELQPDNGSGSQVQENVKYKTKWDRACWTWRGHLGKASNPYASKYQGKGQRIDYFLLSPSHLTSRVVEKCEILGYGEMREGFFCGSDHCPSVVKLRRPLGA